MKEKTQFNFALAWEKEQIKLSGHTSSLSVKMIVAALGGMLVLAAVAGLPYLWQYRLDLNLKSVNQKIAGLSEVEKSLQSLNTLKAQVDSQKQVIASVNKNTKDPAPLLEKLRTLLPTGTKVTGFSLQADNTLTLKASAPTPLDVARLWSSLRDSGLFQEVDIKTVSLTDKAQDLSLTLKLKQ